MNSCSSLRSVAVLYRQKVRFGREVEGGRGEGGRAEISCDVTRFPALVEGLMGQHVGLDEGGRSNSESTTLVLLRTSAVLRRNFKTLLPHYLKNVQIYLT